jgi:hypothetical protein
MARENGGSSEHSNPFIKRAEKSQIYRTASTKNSYNSALYAQNMIPDKNPTSKVLRKPTGPHGNNYFNQNP